MSRRRDMGAGPIHEGEPLGCLKVPFGSKAEAQEKGRPFKQNPYRCPECEKWHLTKHKVSVE